MTLRRIITELGAGADLHGRDMTKAARRAVEDAMRHSSLSLFRGLGLTPEDMKVLVKIGAPEPEKVDAAAVAGLLPYGTVEVAVEQGGVTAEGMGGPGDTVIVAAAVTAVVDIPDGEWRLVDAAADG
ncbi:MAG: Lin0512 family protein [Pseudomonadota bacterium]